MPEVTFIIKSQIAQHLANMRKLQDVEARLKQKRKEAAKAGKEEAATYKKLAQEATRLKQKEKGAVTELTREQKRLGRAAQRVYDETRTPMEAYRQRLQRLRTMVRETGMTQDTYRRGVNKLKAEYRAAGKAVTKLTREQKRLGRAAKRVYDETRTPMERYRQRLQQLRTMVRKTGMTQDTYRRGVNKLKAEYRAAGKAGQKAFGAGALGQLRSMVAGYLGVAAAVGLVLRGLRQVVEERKELARLQAEAAPSAGALAQLTGGDPEKTAELQAAGQAIYAAGGTKSQGEAMRAAFNLQSAGALKERGFVSRLAAVAGEEGIVGLTGEAGKLQKAFGKAETGDYVDVFSKATGAAAPLPKVGVSQILKATTKAAGSGVAMGLSDEELFAAVSRVSGPYDPEEASTAVARMLDQLSVKRPELKGKGIVEIMRTLEAEEMSEADLKTLLQIRGVRAYRVLKDIGGLQGTLATVEQAQRDKAIMGVTKGGEESPLVFPYREKQKQKARLEVARTRETGEQDLWDAQQLRIRERMREEGFAEFRILSQRAAWWMEELVVSPREAARGGTRGIPADERPEWEAKWDKLDLAAERLERAAENLDQAELKGAAGERFRAPRKRVEAMMPEGPVRPSSLPPADEALRTAADSLNAAAENLNRSTQAAERAAGGRNRDRPGDRAVTDPNLDQAAENLNRAAENLNQTARQRPVVVESN